MVDMKFEGLDKIINQLEQMGQMSGIEKVEDELINKAVEIATKEIKTRFNRSKDNSKSGKKGYRPHGHFVDNIPVSKVKNTAKCRYVVVGVKGDNGEYWYNKFPNFGTSKQPPNFAFDFAYKSAQQFIDKEGLKQFENLLQKTLK